MMHHWASLLQRLPILLLLLSSPRAAWGADPDSLAQQPPLSIHILLDSGEVLEVQRIRFGSLGLVHLSRTDGPDSTISPNRVRKITDEQGRDRTKEVLVGEREIYVGGPGPPEERKPSPAGTKGPYWSAHAGMLTPIGGFRDAAGSGFTVTSLLEWRTSRHSTYGAQIEFEEFGGEHGLEDFFSTNTGGAVNELRFQLWGASVVSRLLIHPDHRLTPFVYSSLGIRRFSTSLQGPGAEGSNAIVAVAQDLGFGMNLRMGTALGAELLAAYTYVVTGKSSTRAGDASVSTKGTLQYLQFKAGLVRRFGGNR